MEGEREERGRETGLRESERESAGEREKYGRAGGRLKGGKGGIHTHKQLHARTQPSTHTPQHATTHTQNTHR